MTVVLYRIDDRLIHGQVVVGWGQPLDLRFLVLVDDDVASSEWEQELYRMGVPPGVDVHFHSVAHMSDALAGYEQDRRKGLVLVGSIDTMQRLVAQHPEIRAINVGGVHHAEGRTQRLRYVFLSADEEQALRMIESSGVDVSAQDVPGARAVPLTELLTSRPTD